MKDIELYKLIKEGNEERAEVLLTKELKTSALYLDFLISTREAYSSEEIYFKIKSEIQKIRSTLNLLENVETLRKEND